MKITKLLTIVSIILFFSNCTDNKIKNDLTKENLKGKVRRVIENSYDTEEKFGEVIKTDQYGQKEFYFNEQGYFLQKKERFNYPDYFSYNTETFKYDQQENIIEKRFESNNSMFGESSHKYTYKYDKKGNKIEENRYNYKGELEDKVVYKYDSSGNKIEKNNYNSKGELRSKETYKYDNKGNEIEENWYNSEGELEDKVVYKYDSSANKIEESGYNSKGELEGKVVYIYDNRGNKIEENWYNSEGELRSKETYKYDNKGNEIEHRVYNSDNTLSSEWTYKYDEKGNKREAQGKGYYSFGKLRYNYFDKYDERGNTILSEKTDIKEAPENIGLISNPFNWKEKEVHYVYYDTKTNKKSYVYDKNNNITEEFSYTGHLLGSKIMDEVELKSNHTYQFDNKGNWVVKTSIEKNKVWSITEREIEYYD